MVLEVQGNKNPCLIMLCGLFGSGKSTISKYAEDVCSNVVVLSSDTIRKELYGSEEVQDNPQKVFQILNQRAKEYLLQGKTVYYDATNLVSKRRKATLDEFKKIPNLKSFCVVVVAPYEECLERNAQRERKVPEYVIKRQMASFEFPMMWEGWTDKPIIYRNSFSETNCLEEAYEKLKGLKQIGKWHLEDADRHTERALRFAKRYDDKNIITAVKYHDIGKVYTRTEDENGNSHFYGHEHVSAYLYATSLPSGEISDRDYNIITLIQYHDISWKGNKVENNFSELLKHQLNIVHECDMYGTLMPNQLKEISLMDFIDFFPDWKERIAKEPFNVTVKEQDDYVLLKYNQLDSDFSYKVVQQSRGCILKQINGEWHYVCRPFDKFFNYGEELASNIDWKTATVFEKIDGSIEKLWYDNGKWHLSTNSTIDAFQANVTDLGISFGEIFERALGCSIEELGNKLSIDMTYLFELTSPETRVVIPYEDGVYFLTSFCNVNGTECRNKVYFEKANIKYPKVYYLNTLEEVIKASKELTKDEEGYVIADINSHRIKVKSPEYLIASHLVANHNVSNKTLLNLILDETIDDFIAYAPEYKDRVEKLRNSLTNYERILNDGWERVKNNSGNRKEFALSIKDESEKAYFFRKLDRPELTAIEYIKGITLDNLIEKLKVR